MLEELYKRVKLGLIAARKNGGLTIFDYTKHCMYERAWDEYTEQARGLVLDEQGNIVARCWRKFYNIGERPETKLEALPAETPELSDKLDGSMVIVFHHAETGWRAITRGCWDNPQTQYANGWLSKNYSGLDPKNTYIFELVAPWNRIVIHYPKEEMILLGVVETQSGRDCSYAEMTQEAEKIGLKSVGFQTKPISELDLEDPSVKFKEGFVARFSNGLRVKLKYAQYIALHKIMTGLSVKGIWELLSTGQEQTFENVPDEFMDWYDKERNGLVAAFKKIEEEAADILRKTPKFESRKETAAYFQQYGPLVPLLFMMLDKQNYNEFIWDRLKPKGQTATFQVSEE